MSENTPPTNTSTAEFKNEHLTVKIEKLPNCIAKLNITVVPIASQAAYTKALKDVSKEVSIPGFRKGKAPLEVIKKNYAKFVEKEWENHLMNTSVAEALQLLQLDVYREGIKAARFVKKSKDSDSEIFIEVEHLPEVPSIIMNEITLNNVEPETVSDQEVETELKAMQLNIATWEPNPEKIIEENDYVDLDIVAADNPNELLCEDMRFIVDKEQMSPWMYQALIGAKTGDVKEGINDKAAEKADEQESLPTKFQLTVKGVFTPVLPELNDDFAKKYQADHLDDLKEKVRQVLIRNAESNAQTAIKNQLVEKLLEKYPFDIPTREYAHERKVQLNRIQEKLKNPNLSQLEKLRMAQEVETYAKKLPDHYKMFYLAKKFARDHNIQVSQEEMYNATMRQLMESQNSQNSLIDSSMDPHLMHSIVFNHLILEKVVEYIVKQAQFV